MEQQSKGWFPKSRFNLGMNTSKISLDSSFAKKTIASLATVAFIGLIITTGFSLSTGLDFRWYLVFGAITFSLPFGYCIYKTYLSLVGFFAFGLTFILSIIAGASIVNTMMYSVLACVVVAASLALVRTIQKRRLN